MLKQKRYYLARQQRYGYQERLPRAQLGRLLVAFLVGTALIWLYSVSMNYQGKVAGVSDEMAYSIGLK